MIKQRFISMLVLLCLTVSGAWAAPETPLITIESTGENASFKSGSKTFDDKVTVTFSGNVGNDNDNWGWYTYSTSEITLTVTAAEGYTITGVRFTNNSGSGFVDEAPFEAILVYDGGVVTKVNGTSLGQLGVTKIEVYGYAGAPATVAVTGVTLLPTTATLTVGETETLTATVLPGDATDKSVTWSSSNTSVATVSNEGVVTAVAAGEATITVTATNGTDDTSDDKTATCTVTVTAPTTGSCGANLSWEFDSSNGTLNITGTGDMYDYDDELNHAPWISYHESITSVIIPNGVTSIGDVAFRMCSGLTSIEIPNSVTSIGAGAFMQCTGLTSVTIPNSVESIGAGAFGMCSSLASIEIPNSVTSIGNMAFAMCSGLETVTILAESLESYGTNAFQGTAEGLKIYVPAGSVDTYKGAWADYADKIEAIAVAVTGVTLAPTSATLIVGETETLTATVLPGDATDKSVTWSSSNTSVATVSNEGVVTAVAAGEATITVTATNGTDVTTDDQTATCTVTVTAPAPATYTVSLKEGTEDAEKWQGKAGTGEYQALPLEGLEAGTAITVKYNGRKRVRSVKAVKKAADPLTVPLTMEALTDGTIEVYIQNVGGARRYDFIDDFSDDYSESRKRVPGRRASSNIRVKYSVNGGETTTIYETTTETTTIPVNAGDKVQFYGDATSTQFHGDEPKVILHGTAQTKVYGNIMSLLDEDNYATLTTLPNESVANFAGLFYMNENLTDASGLLLPATTTAGCYYAMFAGCTSLTTAPALPATELAEQCYFYMFVGCTSLTTAPALPATELTGGCYYGMFQGCTSLTTAPALPATTLTDGCYSSMFNGCEGLTTAPTLPAETLASSCYYDMFSGCTSLTTAPALPVTTLAESCYSAMFRGCTSLTTAPALPATELAEECYQNMFKGCTSLTTAPALPATTLANYCYYSMFSGCTSLNSVTCMATNISASNCINNWLQNVAATGTFTKASGTTWPEGANGIPSGWTVNEQ